nr:polyprotein [Grapevine asteroid mosaic associated virus]
MAAVVPSPALSSVVFPPASRAGETPLPPPPECPLTSGSLLPPSPPSPLLVFPLPSSAPITPEPSCLPQLPLSPAHTRRLLNHVRLSGGGLMDVIQSLAPTLHRDTIASPLVEAIAEPYRRSLATYPWAVPPDLHGFLQQCGINFSGQGFQAHPHPAHKTIETHLLHDSWPHLASTRAAVMFMKPSKFAKLQAAQPNFANLYNYRITAKDTTRYPTTSSSLPTEETAFMHDALMYYTPAQILDLFASSPNLQKLYASLVVPPESDFTDISLYPDLYRYRFQGSDLVYELERNPAHNYTQPRSALQWLKTTTIRGEGITLTVSRLDSWGSVHSLLIQRGTPPVHAEYDTISFRAPKAVVLPNPSSLTQPLRDRLVPKDVYTAIFVYVRAVRTLRVTDPAGFVRTQCSKPEYSWVTASAWDNLAHFALSTAPHRPRTTYFLFHSLHARLSHWVHHHTLALTTAGACAASLLAFVGCRVAASFSNQQLRSLACLRRWIVAPPHLPLFRPKAPLLELTLRPKVTGPLVNLPVLRPFRLFPRTCARLGARHPALALFLPEQPLTRSWIPYALGAAAIPLALLAVRWFLGPDSPQAMHDQYHAMFHPPDWHLTLDRTPLLTQRQPFLSFEPAPSPSEPLPPTAAVRLETPPAPTAAAQADSPASAEPKPTRPAPLKPVLVEPPPPPVTAPASQPETVTAPTVPQIVIPASPRALQAEADRIHDVKMADRTPTEIATVAAAEALAPFTNTTSATDAPSESSARIPAPVEEVDPAGQAALASLGLAPSLPASTNPPQSAHLEPSGAVHATTWDQASAPTSDWDASGLGRDGSANGPIALYSELHPANYLPSTGDFLFRDRANGRANLPYPAMDCLLVAVEQATRIPKEALWDTLCATCPDSMLRPEDIRREGLSTDHFAVLAHHYSLAADFHSASGIIPIGMADASAKFAITHTAGSGSAPGHFALRLPDSPKLNGGLAQDLAVAALRFNLSGALLPFRTAHPYTTWPRRAKNLSSNMKNGFDGVMATINPAKPSDAREKIIALDSSLDIAAPRSVRLIHIAGFPGCGKSYPIARLLSTPAFRNFKVAVPTVELRAEWKDLLKLPGNAAWRIGTWESSLLKMARVLVIDEIYKMPRGYLDLAIHADPTIEMVIALGDPLQGEYHSTHASSTNARLLPEPRHLAPYLDYYCLWSHRIPRNVAAFFQVPTSSTEEGFVRHVRELPGDSRILTNSQNAGHTLQQCGYAAVTIASSQGSTYPGAACIHLDRNSSLLSHAHSLVALTRSRKGVLFTGDLGILTGHTTSNRMFAEFYSGKSRPLHDWFHAEFPTATIIHEPITKRHNNLKGATNAYARAIPIRQPAQPALKPSSTADVISSAEIVIGDGSTNQPQISTHFLPETRRPLHFDMPSARAEPADLPQSTEPSTTAFEAVYPGETFENLAAHFLPAHDPTDREIHWAGQLSNQFPHINKEYHLAAQPLSLLAAIHSEKDDPTLLPASIQKRLRFRPTPAPYFISPRDEILGQLLFEGLCRGYHRSPLSSEPFDPVLYAECICLNEFAQLTSKTQAVIMGNARRSDPDWRWSAVRIFSKAQHKVNEGSIFGPWKACQTLALMHDAVVLLLGPVKKYQRVFDTRDRPSTLYLHAGHTPSQMSAWCQRNLTSKVKLANDYTAFDQSQHGEAVVLERKKMERLNIPQQLIDLHVYLKTHVSTQFGPLTCMRLTGEPGTYDDNSDYNLAVINCEYFASSTPVMVSGDDSLLDCEPPRRPEWVVIQPMLALRFKKERSRYATFCGYYASSVGCVRSPVALFAKIAIAVDDGSIPDKLASYLAEFALGHSLGDSLWQALPLSAVPFQSACFDFFCRHAPPELKLSLRLGEVPEDIIARVGSNLRWATHAIYTTLSSAARWAILHSRRSTRSQPEDPDVTRYQGELLQHLQSVPSSRMNPDTLLPLKGGSSAPQLTPEAFSLALAQSMASPNVQAGPPPPSDDRTDRQPPLPRAPRLVEDASAIPFVDYPFQWVVASYDGNTAKNLTDVLSGSKTLSTITANYRHAELLSVELEFAPLAGSFSKPITLSAVWTVGSITPATTTETSYYGGRVITIGGPVLMNSTTAVPADLRRLNPIIKDQISYTDCPRFSYSVYANGGTAGTNLVTVLIRGVVRLRSPSGNLLA